MGFRSLFEDSTSLFYYKRFGKACAEQLAGAGRVGEFPIVAQLQMEPAHISFEFDDNAAGNSDPPPGSVPDVSRLYGTCRIKYQLPNQSRLHNEGGACYLWMFQV